MPIQTWYYVRTSLYFSINYMNHFHLIKFSIRLMDNLLYLRYMYNLHVFNDMHKIYKSESAVSLIENDKIKLLKLMSSCSNRNY